MDRRGLGRRQGARLRERQALELSGGRLRHTGHSEAQAGFFAGLHLRSRRNTHLLEAPGGAERRERLQDPENDLLHRARRLRPLYQNSSREKLSLSLRGGHRNTSRALSAALG